ncbi:MULTISPECIES: hypothetical protein [Rhodococcus]|uniref:Uncharacterized protein n=1 Tax=Rhodococcus jostii TaxID=132919 RepID=A0A1H5LVG1_RHOJO|nr:MULTISPECIES: hypothetical protein [Rhodococcus]SEE81032.1 hypothetical protein SAMN04490220_8446 [Rhodococcus jostii]
MGSALTDHGVARTTLTLTPQVSQAGSIDAAGRESAVPPELARILEQVVSVVRPVAPSP